MKSKIINSSIYLFYLIPIFLISGPALPDISLSLLSLLGIYFYINKKEIIFNNKALKLFSIFSFLFFILLILGGIFAHNVKVSFIHGLLFIRFFLFCVAVFFLIEKNYIKVNKFLYYILTTVLIILSIDGIYEYFFHQNIFLTSTNAYMQNRISGLFGKEWIIGLYTSKFISLYVYLFFTGFKKNLYIFSIALFLSYILIFLSGERAALILSLIPILILFFFIKLNRNYIYLITLFFIIIIFFINFLDNSSFDRLKLIINPSEKYFKMYEVSIKIFLNSPLFGEGIFSYRYLCDDIIFSSYGDAACSTHPHNIYLQLLAESGIFCFVIVFAIFILSLVIVVKNLFFSNKEISPFIFLYSSMIVNLFPLLPSLNFFYNWHDVIIFFPVPFILFEIIKKGVVASGGLEPPRE